LSDEVLGIPQSAISAQNLLDVAWNFADRLVAVGNSGLIIYSTNGTTEGWNFAGGNPVANSNVTLAGIVWDGTQFVVVGGGGTVLTSDDGDIWTIQDSQVNIDLEAIAWTGSQFAAVGGSATVLTSPDAVSWTQAAVPLVVTGSLRGVTANDNLIVAVGNNGAILTSPDGVSWTARASGTSSSLEDATWFDDRFVVAGAGDTLLVSLDGVLWSESGPGTSGISYFGAADWPSSLLPSPLWVVGGSSGSILTSADTAQWQALPSGTDKQLNGIAWMEDQSSTHLIIVGNEGTVLTNIR
jgi:photosystem II stability/assembly factor-like uncharacterized protein